MTPGGLEPIRWESVAHGWWAWMSPMAWQLGVLGVLVFLIDRVLRRWGWPQLRMGLWVLLFLKLLVPPGLAAPWSVSRPVATLTSTAGAGRPNLRPTVSPPRDLSSLLMGVWIGGLVLAAGVTGSRSVRFRRRIRSPGDSAPLPAWIQETLDRSREQLGFGRLPRVRVVESLPSPAVYGALKPVLLIPHDLVRDDDPSAWTREALHHVFLHELAHIRRGDLWIHLVCRTLQLCYWFHPVPWFAGRRIRALREICCDATVARVLGQARGYRRTLLDHARRIHMDPDEHSRWATLGFTGPANIVARLRHLEGHGWRFSRARRVITHLIVLVVGALLIPMATPGRASEVPRVASSAPAVVHREKRKVSLEEQAREVLEGAAAGRTRGCLRIRYAAMALMSAGIEGSRKSK